MRVPHYREAVNHEGTLGKCSRQREWQVQRLRGRHMLGSALFTVQLSHPYMTTGKTTAFTIWAFVGKVMSLPFNTLSRFVIGNGNPLQYSCLANPMD